ncbi:hypothetical protein B0T22DRAFT_535214 [Podospora appendiculata]|uniref:Uncharacterized protein n=1 Tax=Podospora appendiculata TaxID=314037 RepID=A0AAE0X8A8_9PEZI|nr:hypothetical protein B0T22DRAFT_535214 [Podospora appendiculata]
MEACDPLTLAFSGIRLALSKLLITPLGTAFDRIVIDSDGDLILRCGNSWNNREFQVCSAALRRAPPRLASVEENAVWRMDRVQARHRRMGRVAPGRQSRGVRGVILSIIHARFALVPTSPNPLWLFNVMVLCNKYDKTHTVRPWTKNWMTVASQTTYEPPINLVEDPSKISAWPLLWSMYTAWELGNEELFAQKLTYLAENVCLDKQGHLVLEGNVNIDLETFYHLGPLDILETMRKRRHNMIRSVLICFSFLVERRTENGPACHADGVVSEKEKELCDMAVLGSLWKQIFRVRGAHLPKFTNKTDESFRSFYQSAQDIVSGVLKDRESFADGHANCAPVNSFLNKSLKIARTMLGSPLAEGHKQYLKAQRDKSGLTS